MEISDLLVRGWKTVIDHKMDFLWVPDFLNAHFTEDLDCQGSSAILGHGHVSRNNSNLSSMMDLLASIGLDTDDFLRERKRIVVKDRLRQADRKARRKLSLLKMNLELLQSHHEIETSTFVPRNSPKLVASSLTSRSCAEPRSLNGCTLTSV